MTLAWLRNVLLFNMSEMVVICNFYILQALKDGIELTFWVHLFEIIQTKFHSL